MSQRYNNSLSYFSSCLPERLAVDLGPKCELFCPDIISVPSGDLGYALANTVPDHLTGHLSSIL
jgi:hypothetical protein